LPGLFVESQVTLATDPADDCGHAIDVVLVDIIVGVEVVRNW
jgi:hypothetical protein